jgi:hypothetical protein
MAPPKRQEAERFWEKVEVTDPDGCWLWTASCRPSGYGHFALTRDRGASAHRWAYEHLVGPIPDGLSLDHLCRVPRCVNPAHLEPVSARTNILRGIGVAAVNATKTHCPSGHAYVGTNIRIYRGRRHCRACNRLRKKARNK